jgi:predicted permease
VEQQLRLIPGVEDVAEVEHLPLTQSEFTTSFSFRNDATVAEGLPTARLRLINSSFFSTLGIPLLRGRGFTEQDGTDSEPVAIVNEAMTAKFLPNQDVLGLGISPTRNDADGTHKSHVIVGVVGNVPDSLDEDPQPTIYIPFAQMPFHQMCFILRTNKPAGKLLEPARKAVMLVDPNQPVSNVSSMNDLIAEGLEPWRFSLTLMGSLGVVALILTLVGIFGVISYLVRERNKEIGIRLAVGASPTQIKVSILGDGIRLGVAGLVIGIATAVAVTRYMQSMIYGIDRNDSVTYVGVGSLILAAIAFASYLPARWAANVDPLAALREE